MNKVKLSKLPKTWIIDIDGVIFKHNKYKELSNKEFEEPLPGVKKFFAKIPKTDFIILLTARKKIFLKQTLKSLKKTKIPFNLLIMEVPVGERILINDRKPDGLKTAYAFNLKRDKGLKEIKLIFSGEKEK